MAAKKRIYDPIERIGRQEELRILAINAGLTDFWDAISDAWEAFVEYRAAQHKIRYALTRTEWAAIRSLYEDAIKDPGIARKILMYAESRTWQSCYRPPLDVWNRWMDERRAAAEVSVKQVQPSQYILDGVVFHGWPETMWAPGTGGMEYFQTKAPENQGLNHAYDCYQSEIVSLFGYEAIHNENMLNVSDYAMFHAGRLDFAGDSTWSPSERAQFRMQAQIEWWSDSDIRRRFKTFTIYLKHKLSEV